MTALPGAARAAAVLVVDDEPVNRLVLARMLEHLGAEPSEAASGAEALAMLAVRAFDVVLLDIHMPLMGGLQVIERLRAASGPNQHVPVVAVTGDTTQDLRDYLALGFDGYETKPISLASVAAMLRATRQAPPVAALQGQAEAR